MRWLADQAALCRARFAGTSNMVTGFEARSELESGVGSDRWPAFRHTVNHGHTELSQLPRNFPRIEPFQRAVRAVRFLL